LKNKDKKLRKKAYEILKKKVAMTLQYQPKEFAFLKREKNVSIFKSLNILIKKKSKLRIKMIVFIHFQADLFQHLKLFNFYNDEPLFQFLLFYFL